MEGHFLQRLVYDDATTYDLVGAASKVLSESLSSQPDVDGLAHKPDKILVADRDYVSVKDISRELEKKSTRMDWKKSH